MPASTLRLATPADDAALRRLLRENPMPGSISLSYEREPDYFIAAGVDGTLSQTIVNVDDESGALLGMGTRIIRSMYLNGQVQEVGYVSHLRTDRRLAWGMGLARELRRSFEKFHELHADGRVPFYLMSIIADNLPARRLLTSQLPGMPQTREFARMVTYAISSRRARKEIVDRVGIRLERGTPQHLPAILECLRRSGGRHQFAPVWPAETLFSAARTPNLAPGDFFLAVKGSRVLGCLALWDQTPFKQSVVRGYSGSIARWRPLINRLARIVDLPYLPDLQSPFPYCYASHLAVDDDDPRVFAVLLRAVYNECARRGFNYFMIGLSETNPLRPVLVRSYLHIPYRSQIYLLAWEDGIEAAARVDGRVPGLEIAIL